MNSAVNLLYEKKRLLILRLIFHSVRGVANYFLPLLLTVIDPDPNSINEQICLLMLQIKVKKLNKFMEYLQISSLDLMIKRMI